MLFVSLLFAFAHGRASQPSSEYDEVFELELTSDAPTATVEYFVDFQGALFLWTTPELDVSLRVEDVDLEEVVASYDGDTTPHLELQVELNDELAITVAAAEGTAPVQLELHVAASPTTPALVEAARAARARLVEAKRLRSKGEFDLALEETAALTDALVATPGAELSERVAQLAWEIASLAGELGDFTTRAVAWELVVDHYRRTRPADHPVLLTALQNAGSTSFVLGDLTGARALLEEAIEGYERTHADDHLDLLTARQTLASVRLKLGESVDTEELDRLVLEGYERRFGDDHPSVLAVRQNYALSLSARGDLATARALLESVVEVYERTHPDEHPGVLAARQGLAGQMRKQGDYPAARALQEAILETSERTLPADHPQVLAGRQNLAITLYAQGDHAGARRLFEDALDFYVRTRSPDDLELLRARGHLATLLAETGELAAAREAEEAVLQAYERILVPDHPALLTIRTNLAVTLQEMDELDGARALQEAVLGSLERTRPPDDMRRVLALGNLALTLAHQGDLDGARELAQEQMVRMRDAALNALALAPREASEAVRAMGHKLDGVLFLTRDADPELRLAAFELVETLRMVASEAARVVRSSAAPEVQAVMREAESVRARLNTLVFDSDAGEISTDLTRLMQERDRLERRASQLLADTGVVTRPIEPRALADALEPSEAAVGFRRAGHWRSAEDQEVRAGSDHLIAHVVRPDGSLARIDLGRASELQDLALAWRAATGVPLRHRGVGVEGSGDAAAEEPSGDALRARLLDPVLAVLAEETERLYVCADDLVFLVPLDALPYQGGRVGDRWTISSEVSFARLVAPGEPLRTEPGFFALGGVDYAGEERAGERSGAAAARSARAGLPKQFARLPQTRVEVETAGALFGELHEGESVVVTKGDATKDALFEHAAGKRFVHLATHGWFAPETLRSTSDDEGGGTQRTWSRAGVSERVTGMAPMLLCGLALAGADAGRDSVGRMNGIVTAEEMCSLDLTACELAVLSACETNVGVRRAGQGIQSLQAALYAAGARTSITSLWKVDDAATRRLMELFYTNLWEAEMGKAEALWEAKRALREAGAPVRDWAGWVLTGDPD